MVAVEVSMMNEDEADLLYMSKESTIVCLSRSSPASVETVRWRNGGCRLGGRVVDCDEWMVACLFECGQVPLDLTAGSQLDFWA